MEKLIKTEWDKLSDEDKWRRYSNLFEMFKGALEWNETQSAIILDYQQRFFNGMMHDLQGLNDGYSLKRIE